MDRVSSTEFRILEYLKLFKYDKSPTQREIAGYIGKSVSTVNEALGRLESKGWITRSKTYGNTNGGRTARLV